MNDDWITEAVDAHVQSLEEERLPDGKWHPSAISGPCIRKSVLEKNGVPFTTLPDEQTKRIFRIGHIFHKFVQDAVSADPRVKLAIPEISIEIPRLNISGTADILVLLKTGNYELVEIKSIKEAGLNFPLPKSEHVLQASVYTYALREEGGQVDNMKLLPLGERLTHMRVVYLSKETMRVVENSIEYSEIHERLMLSRLLRLSESDEMFNEMGPKMGVYHLPMIAEKDRWFKAYCPYRGSGFCCGDR